MSSYCPEFHLKIDCSQVTCCAFNTQNWDKRIVVYHPEEGAVTDAPAKSSLFSFFESICCCTFGRPLAKKETCKQINIYLLNRHGVSLEEAADAAKIAKERFPECKKPIRLCDFFAIEQEALKMQKEDHTPSPTCIRKCFSIDSREVAMTGVSKKVTRRFDCFVQHTAV